MRNPVRHLAYWLYKKGIHCDRGFFLDGSAQVHDFKIADGSGSYDRRLRDEVFYRFDCNKIYRLVLKNGAENADISSLTDEDYLLVRFSLIQYERPPLEYQNFVSDLKEPFIKDQGKKISDAPLQAWAVVKHNKIIYCPIATDVALSSVPSHTSLTDYGVLAIVESHDSTPPEVLAVTKDGFPMLDSKPLSLSNVSDLASMTWSIPVLFQGSEHSFSLTQRLSDNSWIPNKRSFVDMWYGVYVASAFLNIMSNPVSEKQTIEEAASIAVSAGSDPSLNFWAIKRDKFGFDHPVFNIDAILDLLDGPTISTVSPGSDSESVLPLNRHSFENIINEGCYLMSLAFLIMDALCVAKTTTAFFLILEQLYFIAMGKMLSDSGSPLFPRFPDASSVTPVLSDGLYEIKLPSYTSDGKYCALIANIGIRSASPDSIRGGRFILKLKGAISDLHFVAGTYSNSKPYILFDSAQRASMQVISAKIVDASVVKKVCYAYKMDEIRIDRWSPYTPFGLEGSYLCSASRCLSLPPVNDYTNFVDLTSQLKSLRRSPLTGLRGVIIMPLYDVKVMNTSKFGADKVVYLPQAPTGERALKNPNGTSIRPYFHTAFDFFRDELAKYKGDLPPLDFADVEQGDVISDVYPVQLDVLPALLSRGRSYLNVYAPDVLKKRKYRVLPKLLANTQLTFLASQAKMVAISGAKTPLSQPVHQRRVFTGLSLASKSLSLDPVIVDEKGLASYSSGSILAF